MFERLAVIMRLMAGGDAAAVFMLYGEFGAPIAGAVRRHLAAVGVRAAPREDIDGLVIEACLELFDCAGGWDPDGGALPWNWAERRLRTMVSRSVDRHTDPFDDEWTETPGAECDAAGGEEPEPLEVLRRCQGVPLCDLLMDALTELGSDRDRRLLLEMGLQRSLGDPSPALTVAPRFGMQPPAVRQAVKRMKDKLRGLARTDVRYASLADIALLA